MKKVSKKTKAIKKFNIGKILLITFLIAFLVLLAGLIGVAVAVIKSSPDITSDILNNLQQSSKIYDMNGKYIEDYSDSKIRNVVALNLIPVHLQNAFIAIEDERFEQHHGIDFKRIIGAVWVDIKTHSFTQGASTITEQLVKNVFLTNKKEITRKLQEAYMALQLERKLSKDQILEAYLNTIFLGGSSYGVEAAAMNYFGKDVKNLTISESAFLAGLNKNPSKYYPYKIKNITDKYVLLYDRRNVVLKKMFDLKYIDAKDYTAALAEKFNFKAKQSANKVKYQWFIEPAIDEIAVDFSNRYGIDKNDAKQKLRVGGYSIYLTIDTNIQKAAEEVINDPSNYMKAKLPSRLKSYTTEKATKDNPTPEKYAQPQAAAVIYDYATGQMRAIVGGRGPHPQLSTNRATAVPRQPGSSIKPLSVYGPSIDTKLVTAATIMSDTKMSPAFIASHNWDPHNYETNKFSGNVTIRTAIKNSINIVAIKLADELNPDPPSGVLHNEFSTSIDYLQNKFHLSTIITNGPNSDRGLSPLALGALTEGVYPYEMAAAYGVFANGGVYTSPVMYTKVIDNMDNDVLDSNSTSSQSISPQAAFVMVDMMRGVVNGGTGTKANLGKMPAAGKTGTATDNTNLWFCGVTPYYSGVVWLGHDIPNVSLKGMSSSDAAKMWGKIMKKAHANLKVKKFAQPNGIVSEPICIDSGKSPNELCYKDPRGNRVINEVFIDGTQPIEICDFHKYKPIIIPPKTTPGGVTTTVPGVDTVPPSQ